jgi:small subunit ribosomal protein S1
MKAAADELGIEIAVADPTPEELAAKEARQAKRAAERAAREAE